MKNQPLVSVIIPVFNVEKYLNECIDSVISQTYKNIEIILVDDGSTDSSGKICDIYAENNSNIKVIHKENGGQSVARNTGLDLAIGKYVFFIDSDDIVLCDAVEKLLNTAEKAKSDIVFFDAYSFLDESQKQINQSYIRKYKYNTENGIEVLEKMLERNEYHCVLWVMLFNREFLVNTGIRLIPDISYEDMAFTYMIMCLAKTVCPLNVKQGM